MRKNQKFLGNAIKEAFGEYAEDVISPIKSAADVCDWLGELFKIIRQEAERKRPDRFKLRKLADMGVYLAMDFGTAYDYRHAEMFGALKKAGQLPADLVRRPELSACGLG